jgi:predicted RNA binding protein YcfA (HicA-like mRNA interferase family)
MTKNEKLILKFKNNPISLKYIEIENLLLQLWFDKIDAKWSHVKFKNKLLKNDIILPLHNNDCKDFYKKQLLKNLITYNLI